MKQAYRHGEVLIETTDAFSENSLTHLKELFTNAMDNNKLETVLAVGTSGTNKHEIDTPAAFDISSKWIDGMAYGSMNGYTKAIYSEKPFKVIHPEHKTLEIPAGMYLVRIMREYSEDRSRNVID